MRSPASNTSHSSARGTAIATNSRSNRRATDARQNRQRLAAVGHQQHVAAQIEEAGELVAPSDGFCGPGARDRRQVARDQAHGEKREQRDPVLRVGDRERANRRQEEEVQAQHGRDRRRDGSPKARGGGNEEHDHQIGRRHGRGVRDSKPARENSVTAPTASQAGDRRARHLSWLRTSTAGRAGSKS